MIQKEQAFLRDDLHELSTQLAKQPFNVIAHKRIKKPKPIIDTGDEKDSSNVVSSGQLLGLKREINTCGVTEEGDEKRKEVMRKRINTLDSHFSSKSNDKNVRLKLKMNQTLNLKAATKESTTAQGQNNLRRKQSQFSTFQNMFKVQKSKPKLAKDIEKQFNKGPLKEKHMMNWLNQILVEECFDVQNEKGALRGLERFGLDNNSLISRGIHPSNIFQLYRSLFVYSIGLNNLLKDLTGTSRSVMKSIWKVYAILLQYCSEGNFQTIMSQLQRDMMDSQNRLKKQIEKRQILLDKNDEIIEQRLYKYIKQNKELKQKVKELQETNEVIEKACKQMEVGFNMEVTLRLAYQYKINEIYSVHERLNVLHLNLYQEYQEKERLNRELDSDCWNVKERNMELKVVNEQLAQRMKEAINIQKMNENIIDALHMNEAQLQEKLTKEMMMKKDEIVDLRDKERRIAQLEREVSSCNLIIKMMKENSNSQFQEYRRITSQDKELRSTNQAQSEKIGELMATVKILKEKSSNMLSNIEISDAKIIAQKETIKKQEETINDLRVRLERKEIEIQTKNSEMESHQKMCDSMGKTTKQIEILYHRLEEEYKLTQKHCEYLGKEQKQLHEENLALRTHKKNILAENETLQIEVNKQISEVLNLQKKYDSDNVQQIKKYEALHKIYSHQDNTQSTMADKLATTASELQAANFRISFLSQKYTDEKFEKAKLQSIYKDMLILHEREKDNQKELMINISTLVERNQELQRQMALMEKLQQQKMKEMKGERMKMANRMAVMEGMLKNKDGFVHPMLLEDAMHHLQREMEDHAQNKRFSFNRLQKQIATNEQIRMEYQRREHEFKQYMREQEKRMEFFKSQVESERQYFKLKSEELHKLNYELETKLNFKSLQVEKKTENEMNSEGKVVGLINEKNKQIQELLSELQRIEDNFQKKCEDYESEIQVIHKDKENIITQLKVSKKELESKVTEIEKSYAAKLLEKQQEKEEIQVNKKYKNQDYVPAMPVSKTAEDKREQFKKALKFAAVYYKK